MKNLKSEQRKEKHKMNNDTRKRRKLIKEPEKRGEIYEGKRTKRKPMKSLKNEQKKEKRKK